MPEVPASARPVQAARYLGAVAVRDSRGPDLASERRQRTGERRGWRKKETHHRDKRGGERYSSTRSAPNHMTDDSHLIPKPPLK